MSSCRDGLHVHDAHRPKSQILENNTLKKLGKARVDEITLIEHRRAHNISIELSGIKLSFEGIKEALVHLDDSMLGVEQLDALSRAIPDDDEREQLRQYLEGKHPKHMVGRPIGKTWLLHGSCSGLGMQCFSAIKRRDPLSFGACVCSMATWVLVC